MSGKDAPRCCVSDTAEMRCGCVRCGGGCVGELTERIHETGWTNISFCGCGCVKCSNF